MNNQPWTIRGEARNEARAIAGPIDRGVMSVDEVHTLIEVPAGTVEHGEDRPTSFDEDIAKMVPEVKGPEIRPPSPLYVFPSRKKLDVNDNGS